MKLLSKAPLMYWGAHLGVAGLKHASIAKLEAAPTHSDHVLRVEVDGESPGRLPARFEVHPGALRLRIPAG